MSRRFAAAPPDFVERALVAAVDPFLPTVSLNTEPAVDPMQIPLPQRVSITGMAGLAALSTTHWIRGKDLDLSPVLAFVLGVMPNLAASFAMPLILASILPLPWQAPDSLKLRRTFLWTLAFTTSGLCGWEFFQMQSNRFVFDTSDLLATGIGSFLAYLAFRWLVGRSMVTSSQVSMNDLADRKT